MGHLMDLIHLGGHYPSPPRLVIIGGKQLTCVDTVQWGMACPAGVVVYFDNIVIHLWIMFSSTSLIMSSPNERVDVSDTNNEHHCGERLCSGVDPRTHWITWTAADLGDDSLVGQVSGKLATAVAGAPYLAHCSNFVGCAGDRVPIWRWSAFHMDAIPYISMPSRLHVRGSGCWLSSGRVVKWVIDYGGRIRERGN